MYQHESSSPAAAQHFGFRAVRGAVYQVALQQMFRVRPERIHHSMSRALQAVSSSPALCRALDAVLPVKDPALAQTLAGVTFPRPLGLAAGFDKNAEEVNVWGPLGFGYAEVGTVTALAQPGNPTPRLFRLPADHAILNRMGFNNDGAIAAARRLRRRVTRTPIGVNLGKSKLTDPAVAAGDYRESARAVGETADYLVINVSSPNTPGLRDLQAVESLRPIISAVRQTCSRPLFVKIAPDLSNDDVIAVTDLALDMGIDGLIATNTTISREGLATDRTYVGALGAGGISGRPVAQRSTEVLELISSRVKERSGDLILISVGGIETPRQAWERISAGAHLIQGYTGFIYGGLDWIRDIHHGLSAQLKAHGLNSISEAVGAGLPWTID